MAFFLRFVFEPPPVLLHGVMLTVGASIVAMLLGLVCGTALAVGGLSGLRALRVANQAYIGFFRGTPVLVQLVLIYFGVPSLLGIDLFPRSFAWAGLGLSGALVAGVLTFGLHEAAYVSEIVRGGIRSIPPGQAEAARALGLRPWVVMLRVILPQAVRVSLPPLGNQFNTMLKTTSLLSVIAIPEMFQVAESVQSATYRTFEVYLGISVYYLVLTGIWTLIQGRIERRLVRRIGDLSPGTRG